MLGNENFPIPCVECTATLVQLRHHATLRASARHHVAGWLPRGLVSLKEENTPKQNGDDDMSEGVENRPGSRQLARMMSCSVVWCSVQHR